MKYAFINQQGLAVGGGTCQEIDVAHTLPPEGCRVIWGVLPPGDFLRLWRWDGARFVDQGPRFPETYATRRMDEYPSSGEQLDMLWHGMDENPTTRVEPWYSFVKAIKEQYPKP